MRPVYVLCALCLPVLFSGTALACQIHPSNGYENILAMGCWLTGLFFLGFSGRAHYKARKQNEDSIRRKSLKKQAITGMVLCLFFMAYPFALQATKKPIDNGQHEVVNRGPIDMKAVSIVNLIPEAHAQTPYTCKENADCRLVTSYVPPVDGRPGKTLVKCNHNDKPLQEGETLTEYNDYLTGQCGCIEATQTCGLKD